MKSLYLIWVLGFLVSCNFFKENLPIANPGVGVKKQKDHYEISFDVGVFIYNSHEISRNTIERMLEKAIQDLQKRWKFLRLHAIVDQPQDAPFIMERVVSKRFNPFIETFRIQKKLIYLNNFIVEEVEDPQENLANSKKQFYFLSSQLHHFLYSQVRYDLLVIPFPIISDFDYSRKRKTIEIHEVESGIAKGRSALDKLGYIVHIDYDSVQDMASFNRLKIALISLALGLPVRVSKQFLSLDCKECERYIQIRKKIFDLYFQFNQGKIPDACKNFARDWVAWQSHPFMEKHNTIILKQLKENFLLLKKKCN